MPATVKPFCPKYVTERFGIPPYVNCNFASGLMLGNKATHNKKGTASTTVRALRRASGALHDATGPRDLINAYKNLWKWKVSEFPGSFDALVANLRIHDSGAVIYIYPHNLPAHYRRWDVNFTGGHAIYVQATEPNTHSIAGRIWMLDPMIKEKGYTGEWIHEADLRPAMQSGVNSVVLNQDQFA